jgi:hypothetical protein
VLKPTSRLALLCSETTIMHIGKESIEALMHGIEAPVLATIGTPVLCVGIVQRLADDEPCRVVYLAGRRTLQGRMRRTFRMEMRVSVMTGLPSAPQNLLSDTVVMQNSSGSFA